MIRQALVYKVIGRYLTVKLVSVGWLKPVHNPASREVHFVLRELHRAIARLSRGDRNLLAPRSSMPSVLFTPDGPLRGADAIRHLFQALIAEFGKPGAVFSTKQQSVEGEYAYIL